MKTINIVLQSKGGSGKSTYTALVALKYATDNSVAFIDLDNSTRSSMRQLKHLGENRLEFASLANEKDMLIRDNLVSYLESLVDAPFEQIFFDTSAGISQEFPAFIEHDLPFEEFLGMLNMTPIFHVVIAGGNAYAPCVEYLQNLYRVIENKSSIIVWANITSFNQHPELLDELKKNCSLMDLRFEKFGDFDPQSSLGNQILNNIRLGLPLEEYTPGAKLRMMKDLKDNITI